MEHRAEILQKYCLYELEQILFFFAIAKKLWFVW